MHATCDRRRSQQSSPPRRRSPSPEIRPSFGTPVAQVPPQRLDESNKGHQLLKKMGWAGAGLGASEQGIAEPIKEAEVRDRSDMYRGEYVYSIPSKAKSFLNV